MDEVPVFIPYLGIDTLKHISEALDVGWLGMGAFTQQFERLLEEYLQLDNRWVIATNTGTAAIHLALLAAGVGPGDEVITPSFNYVADHQAITATGARVVMCDIRDDNLGIDCEKAEKLVSERTKALLPLHFAGIPCDRGGVYRLAAKHRLRVVEDGCHAFGTCIDGRPIGSSGDLSCFSFDPIKVLTSVDGGAVVTGCPEELEHLRHLRLLGVDKDTILRYRNQRAWEYDVVCQGFRYHMNNVTAAIGISQLKRVAEFIVSRREVCRRYNQAFAKLEEVQVPPTDFSDVSPFIYVLRVRADLREALIEDLKGQGIATGIHFVPVHRHHFYRGAPTGDLSVTERVCAQVLTLPLHSLMKPASVERVIQGILGFFDRRAAAAAR